MQIPLPWQKSWLQGVCAAVCKCLDWPVSTLPLVSGTLLSDTDIWLVSVFLTGCFISSCPRYTSVADSVVWKSSKASGINLFWASDFLSTDVEWILPGFKPTKTKTDGIVGPTSFPYAVVIQSFYLSWWYQDLFKQLSSFLSSLACSLS